jgi:hypothetical protein
MQEKSVPPTEMTYTAMARVAAGEGDGARAESLVRMGASGCVVRCCVNDAA